MREGGREGGREGREAELTLVLTSYIHSMGFEGSVGNLLEANNERNERILLNQSPLLRGSRRVKLLQRHHRLPDLSTTEHTRLLSRIPQHTNAQPQIQLT